MCLSIPEVSKATGITAPDGYVKCPARLHRGNE